MNPRLPEGSLHPCMTGKEPQPWNWEASRMQLTEG